MASGAPKVHTGFVDRLRATESIGKSQSNSSQRQLSMRSNE